MLNRLPVISFHQMSDLIQTFVIFWTVIDPIGTIPIFLAVTRRHKKNEVKIIAIKAVSIAACILLLFLFTGQFLLESMKVSLASFQVAGGLIMFAFAFDMIFGESKPDYELRIFKSSKETAIFPLAVPAIASPGSIMAVVVLTDIYRFDIVHQITTSGILLSILFIQLLLLFAAVPMGKILGEAGASLISRIMGIILASVAMNSILLGIKTFFNL